MRWEGYLLTGVLIIISDRAGEICRKWLFRESISPAENALESEEKRKQHYWKYFPAK